MDNRFKFRVFLKYNQIMYDIDSYCFLQGLNKCVFHFTNGGQKTLKNDDFIIMQCTGLKDKNGKLIYEGDILRYPPKDQYEEKNYVACEVFFHNNDCCDNHIGFQINRYRFQGVLCGIANYGTKYKFIPKNTEKMEVIGNVFENPELVKE